MKLMSMVLLVCVVAMLCGGTAFGTIYSYDESQWSLEKNDSYYWGVFYGGGSFKNSSYMQFQNASGSVDGTGFNGNRGAFAWTAPAGEYITKIDFSWGGNFSPSDWKPVVYVIPSGQSLNWGTATVWSAPSMSGSTTINFAPADQVAKVGLGFAIQNYSYPAWFMQFSNAQVTTVPEPMTIGLLAVGGLLLRKRQ